MNRLALGLGLLLIFGQLSFGAVKKQKIVIPKECSKAFAKIKVKNADSCEMDCNLSGVDMSSFDCSRFCDNFCEDWKDSHSKSSNGPIFKLSNLYPGLTDSERKFADENPSRAIAAYRLSWEAESICKDEYRISDTNDESDACRHFVWAGLLNEKFGSSVASEILDAHEANPDEPENEKSMDLANNRRGVIVSSRLISEKKMSPTEILNQFKEDLKNGKLVVLKKGKSK
jgi:hypothetical protein